MMSGVNACACTGMRNVYTVLLLSFVPCSEYLGWMTRLSLYVAARMEMHWPLENMRVYHFHEWNDVETVRVLQFATHDSRLDGGLEVDRWEFCFGPI